ncbi:flagellar filament capping protein FliD [Desnuesiella massiliensis]|uniref:flagellar filament capping protein FliD n=1 Tax=Desnuesiella massiliensis TaxID=1650662 RepID=UPI0006E306C9|nr:flagellar filament capping protein FliD [Desnuesiella massiliensis]
MMISPNRITGLATGMDTDNMVKQMMKPYLMRMDKLKQDRQIVQWKQDLLRETIGNVGGFKRNYFDVLKSDKYMLSGNAVSTFSVDGLTDNSLKVKAGAGAKAGNYEVTIDQLAKAAELEGSSIINTVIAGKANYGIKIDSNNNTFTVDGTQFSLDVDSVKGYNKYSSLSELAAAMNSKMAATDLGGGQKLSDTVKAVVKNDSIQFMEVVNLVEDKATPANSNNKITLNYGGKDYQVTLAAGKYTADELTAAINSKLAGLKSTDGTTTFPKDKKITATTNASGTNFQIDGAAVSIKDGKSVVLNPAAKSVNSNNSAPGVNTDAVIVDGISLQYKNEIIAGFNDTLTLRIGTTIKNIKLTEQIINSDNDLKNSINAALTAAGVTTDELSVDINAEGKLVFNSKSGNQLSFFGNASSVFGAFDNFEINMGGNTRLSELSQFSGKQVNFIINDKEFKYDFSTDVTSGDMIGAKNKTLDQIIGEINSKAEVNISYSTASKKFTIASNGTGASSSLTFTDKSGGFLNTIFGTNSTNKTGEDAQVTIKGPNGTSTYSKPQNAFEIDGVSYNLNSMPTGTVKFSLTQNVDEAFNKIKAFIDDYNKLIGDINSKIIEKKQYKYLPLTDEQKKDMKENDIKLWDEKARQGLVRNDSDLSNMLGSLRRAFYDSVKDVGLSLKDIGLDTSSDYSENGKIVIDETKLREALKNNGDKVTELLTKKSSSFSRYDPNMPSSARDTRYKEEGIFQRISDVLEDYTRTTSGKGILLNKAGIKGDFTDSNNTISEDLKNRDKKIKEMEEKLFDRENKYYLQFARLEKAMQQMNAQSNWLAQQLGGGGK